MFAWLKKSRQFFWPVKPTLSSLPTEYNHKCIACWTMGIFGYGKREGGKIVRQSQRFPALKSFEVLACSGRGIGIYSWMFTTCDTRIIPSETFRYTTSTLVACMLNNKHHHACRSHRLNPPLSVAFDHTLQGWLVFNQRNLAS